MLMSLGHEEIVLIGYSHALLLQLADVLPDGSVVVIEEPDLAIRRDVARLSQDQPAMSRVILWEYQRAGSMAGLLAAEPSLQIARAVLPGIEYAVGAAADLADLLSLPGAGTNAGLIFRDKARQRALAAAVGLRNPDHEVIDDAVAGIDFLTRHAGRCVIKPTARQASLGVRFINEPGDVAPAIGHASAVAEDHLSPDRGIESDLLIERAVDGTEFSVEMLLTRSRPCFSNVTAKLLLPGPFPVELGHRVPGATADDADDLIAATACLAAAAKFTDGILHAEWIVDSSGPVLIECAARLPGDEIGTLISLAYGFNLTATYLQVLLGDPPGVPATPERGAAIRFLTATPGIVTEVTGVAEAAATPGVHTVRVPVQPGGTVRPVTSSWDRSGYVIATGPTAAQAAATAEVAVGLIRIGTRPA